MPPVELPWIPNLRKKKCTHWTFNAFLGVLFAVYANVLSLSHDRFPPLFRSSDENPLHPPPPKASCFSADFRQINDDSSHSAAVVDLQPKHYCSWLTRRGKKITRTAAAAEQTGPQPSKLIALIRLSGAGACNTVSSHRFKLKARLSTGSDWAAGKHAALSLSPAHFVKMQAGERKAEESRRRIYPSYPPAPTQ